MSKLQLVGFGLFVYLLTMLFVVAPQVIAQTVSERDITLEQLGYEDTPLQGSSAMGRFAFDLPPTWEIVEGSRVNLDFELNVNTLTVTTSTLSTLLEVRFNSQPLQTVKLITLSAGKINVELPVELFNQSNQDTRRNIIEVALQASSNCPEPVGSNIVTIQKSSLLHLAYRERPMPIDLALFPSPIFQRWSVDPSQARIVLPDKFDEADIQAAIMVAARLGQLTAHRLPFSITLASQYLDDPNPAEHLIVIGQPDQNALFQELKLPAPLITRQLTLVSQMPAAVAPNTEFSYTLLVKNTASNSQSLYVEDQFSGGKFIACNDACEQISPLKIRWNIGSLKPQQELSTTITVKTTSVFTLSTAVRHTATLFDSSGKMLNVDTLATPFKEKADESLISSPQQRSDSFFGQSRQAVAEDAGVIQELVSPWNSQRVVVVVTGLTDEALIKAAAGLNPRNRFPGIWGQSAIVEELQPITRSTSIYPREFTLGSLGHEDEELIVLDLDTVQYAFDFPADAILDKDSHLTLHLAHAPSVSKIGGALKITLNGITVASTALDDSNLNSTWLTFPLSQAAVKPGRNILRFATTFDKSEECVVKANYWLTIYKDSFLHLNSKAARIKYDLSNFPYPFTQPGDLTNVLFALSDQPDSAEIEGVLQVASLIGSRVDSKEFLPSVRFGGEPEETVVTSTHILAIGLPTTNSYIRTVNDLLPQPFVPDSNQALQRIDIPTYAITPDTDLGFVQMIVSPWTEGDNLALVIATGTSGDGLTKALTALAQPAPNLSGNLTLIRDDQVSSIDTRPPLVEEIITPTITLTSTLPVTTATPIAPISEDQNSGAMQPTGEMGAVEVEQPAELARITVTPLPTAQRNYNELPANPVGSQMQPRWLLPILIVSVLGTIGLIVFWLRRSS